jgi:membrane fusion protein (multidrug efflux system)
MKLTIDNLALFSLLPLLTAGCGTNAQSSTDTAPVSEQEPTAAVRTVQVSSQEVTDIAVLSADILPVRRATLAAEVAGTVEEVRADIGDRVRAGARLCTIDTRALQQQVAEAEALFRQAQDRFQRAERLFAKRSITKEQHIDAIASRDVAEARLASARLQLDKSKVEAPWSGQVAERYVEVGDYASPGQPLFDIVDVDRVKVRAPVSSADAPFVAAGTPVRVLVDALPGEEFTGRVVRLGAELDPDTRTLSIEAEIDNSDGRLRPGFFGRLEVQRRVLPDAILIPLTAVIDFENHRAAYVVNSDRAERRIVELGPVVGENVVVTSGIEDGERVIVAGLQQVADGQRVSEADES